jgi:hypothetical protein
MLLDPPTRPSSAFETPSVTATSNNGVNVAAANNSGVTPLMLAIRIGDTATFASLMERPQNLNLADNQGRTALHYAGAQRSAYGCMSHVRRMRACAALVPPGHDQSLKQYSREAPCGQVARMLGWQPLAGCGVWPHGVSE